MDRIPFKRKSSSEINEEELQIPPNYTKNDLVGVFCLGMNDLTEEQLNIFDEENIAELFYHIGFYLDYIWHAGGEGSIGALAINMDMLRTNILMDNNNLGMLKINSYHDRGDEIVSGVANYELAIGGSETEICFGVFVDTSLVSSNKKSTVHLNGISTSDMIESGIYYKIKSQDKSITTLSLNDDESKQLSKAERFKKVKEKIIKAFNKNKNYE